MRNQRSVLAIALVTGEEIEPAGLKVLRVCVTEENQIIILSGISEVEQAIIESVKRLEEPNSTVLFLAVERVPANSRRIRRRVRRGGAE